MSVAFIGGSEGGPRGAVPLLALLLTYSTILIPETGIIHSHCIQKYRKPMGK